MLVRINNWDYSITLAIVCQFLPVKIALKLSNISKLSGQSRYSPAAITKGKLAAKATVDRSTDRAHSSGRVSV